MNNAPTLGVPANVVALGTCRVTAVAAGAAPARHATVSAAAIAANRPSLTRS
jgi:hypothetical protein